MIENILGWLSRRALAAADARAELRPALSALIVDVDPGDGRSAACHGVRARYRLERTIRPSAPAPPVEIQEKKPPP
jgi:hypothetical protein